MHSKQPVVNGRDAIAVAMCAKYMHSACSQSEHILHETWKITGLRSLHHCNPVS
jgi:hypothetical protein